MLLRDFLNAVIDDGIEAVRMTYLEPSQSQKREGAMRGFEDCRNKQPMEIGKLLIEANLQSVTAYRERHSDYWYWRFRELQIEWVANVLSVILMNERQPVLVQPTGRALEKAMEILGS